MNGKRTIIKIPDYIYQALRTYGNASISLKLFKRKDELLKLLKRDGFDCKIRVSETYKTDVGNKKTVYYILEVNNGSERS
ncbi:MAG: hypothetical protein ACLRVU_01175 [Beduini sp.]